MEEEVGPAERNDLLHLRDGQLKQIVATLAALVQQRPASVHRRGLELGLDLLPVIDLRFAQSDADEHQRARRLRTVYLQLQDYLNRWNELPASAVIQVMGVVTNTAAPTTPDIGADDDEEDAFDLDGDLDGFAGGLSNN